MRKILKPALVSLLFICLCAAQTLAVPREEGAKDEKVKSAVHHLNLKLKQHGSIKSETAYRVSHPQEFTKARKQLILTETGSLSQNLNFKLSGRFYYDLVYEYTNNFPQNAASDQKKEAELREAYIDYSRGAFDLRLGKQQIVWGEAVGLFFADVVNAKDLREFLLPDFDMIRIPQWGADLEYAEDKFHAELVWLPILEFNKLGVEKSEFAFPYLVPENISYLHQDPDEPKNSLENSEAGARLSYLTSGWDFSVFYFYTWDKFPVMFRTIDPNGAYRFRSEYRRLNITGATFAKEINDIVLKGEFIYNRKSYFPIFDITNSDGVTQKDFIDYLLGLDYTMPGGIDTNFQFMQRIIFDYDSRMAGEHRLRNSVSLRASKGFLDNNLELEFLVIASLIEKDLLYRPKATYSFKNNWKFKAGLDIFQGDPLGVFGKFDKKDRAYFELSYSF